MTPMQQEEINRRVSRAARAWEEAEMLSPEEVQKILERYPEECSPESTTLLVSFFLFASSVSLFLLCGGGLLHFLVVGRFEPSFPLLAIGLALCHEGDRMYRRPGFGNAGESVAIQLWGTVFTVAGLAFLGPFRQDLALSSFSLVVFGLAAWRWGRGIFAALATAALFLAIHVFAPHPGAWFVASLVLGAGSTFSLIERRSASTVCRRCGLCVLAISLLVLYLAVNRYAVDARWLFASDLFVQTGKTPTAGNSGYALFSTAATALYPLLLIAWGLLSRLRMVLNFGLFFLLLSLATLYGYWPALPLWTVFLFGGAALARLAWWQESWLNRRPGQEWRGFTAQTLYENPLRVKGLGQVSKLLGKGLTRP